LANVDSQGVITYIVYPYEENIVLGLGVSLLDSDIKPSPFSNGTYNSSVDLNATSYTRTAIASDVNGLVNAAETLTGLENQGWPVVSLYEEFLNPDDARLLYDVNSVLFVVRLTQQTLFSRIENTSGLMLSPQAYTDLNNVTSFWEKYGHGFISA
jgi:hypothetical protein